MKKFKTPLLFALAMLPVALIGGILVVLYQIDLYPEEVLAQAIEQIGGKSVLVIIGAVQSAGYGAVSAFFGCILAQKLGLWKSLKMEKKPLLLTVGLSAALGILFSLDYWVFGGMYPEIRQSCDAGLTPVGIISAVLYGGIVEELLLRLLFMSALAWVIWKLFCRKAPAGDIPQWVFILANVIAAIAFAAGHLPATLVTFGELTPVLLIRCFLLNGGFGLYFGWLYRKFGIQYAMLGHAGLHIVSKLIWLIFI